MNSAASIPMSYQPHAVAMAFGWQVVTGMFRGLELNRKTTAAGPARIFME